MTEQNKQSYTSLFASVSEAANSVVKIAENNVVSRVQSAVSSTLRTIILSLVAAVLGLLGALLVLIGLAIWLGMASGYGTWFGLVAIGAVALLAAFIANLMRQTKK